MDILYAVAGVALVAASLWETFENVILTRRVSRRLRMSSVLFRVMWRVWRGAAQRMRSTGRRENLLSFYGPLSILAMLVLFATALIFGFALLHLAAHSRLAMDSGGYSFWVLLYMSGTTFFTLGLGDVTPVDGLGRALVAIESGVGFGFLAVVLSYLPVLYQAFSKREAQLSMLDEWAGSPPTAQELLRRTGGEECVAVLGPFLAEWERWSAELLESTISYPILAFFRSQHDNTSWLGALTVTLDSCALLIAANVPGVQLRAQRTFAMARHAAVDISQILDRAPEPPAEDRLPSTRLHALARALGESGPPARLDADAEARLIELRRQYEGYVHALSLLLLTPLPPWTPGPGQRDNWQKSRWK